MKVATKFLSAACALFSSFITLQAQGGAPAQPQGIKMPSLGYTAKTCTSDDYSHILSVEQHVTLDAQPTSSMTSKLLDQIKRYGVEFEKRAQVVIGTLTREDLRIKGENYQHAVRDVIAIIKDLEVKFKAEAERDIPPIKIVHYSMNNSARLTSLRKQKMCTDRPKGIVADLMDQDFIISLD